ncbi:DUF1189 family protein [Pontibacillus marinus]|uniref:DUF1189 domain-containing protein n=1 Tax=Pontibacillus marinus BH030004 = DSM 16465 TaxID=1385511 RepID=A0A0A5FWZ6_9BACI|nr:DUF1189 family protein [Pontibacillus marinus]KGX85346.1 hypothetical protein N783_14880 [Pontibacillus marinus BH030004 = DSM 16465]
MNIGKQFIYSFYHLKRVSTFRIQKIGKPIGYLFFVMAITMLFNIIQFLNSPQQVNVVGENQFPLALWIPLLYLFTTALKFIGVSFLATVGLFIKEIMKKPLQYKHTWTLSAYAVTTPTLLFAILEAFSWQPPFAWLLYWVLAIGYLYLIIRYIPKPKKRNTK